jgi:hypothetical protein
MCSILETSLVGGQSQLRLQAAVGGSCTRKSIGGGLMVVYRVARPRLSLRSPHLTIA